MQIGVKGTRGIKVLSRHVLNKFLDLIAFMLIVSEYCISNSMFMSSYDLAPYV